MKRLLIWGLFTVFIFSNGCSSGGNQGVDESGSADSNTQMNTDTLMIDTSAVGTNADSGSVPIPTQ